MFDVNKIRNDFPMIVNNPGMIYFDNSATTFKPQVVIDEIVDYYSKYNSNIHRGEYDISGLVSNNYDHTRKLVKDFINAEDENEIVFTSGSSMSLNIVAFGYALKHLKKGDVILTTYTEHASNILPWFKVCEKTGAIIKYIDLNKDGSFNIDLFKNNLNSSCKIISLPFISNVLGYINPIKEIVKLAHENNSLVNVDAAQAAPHLKIDVKDIDVDFLSFSSHKLYGPAGVGVLYSKKELLEDMDPLIYGGGSNARFDADGKIILKKAPFKFESGTPCIEGVLGFAKAINYLNEIGLDNIYKYEFELARYFISKLNKLDNVLLINPNTETGIISFNIKDIFAQDVASYLNSKKICVRTGNHCAKILHNLIGTDQTIRASLSFYNTKEEIDYFCDVLKDITLEKCLDVIIC